MGVDLLLKKKWSHHHTWLTWSISGIEYQFPTFPDQFFPAPQDQRHQILWTHMVSYPKWGFTLSWNFRTGRPFSIPSGVNIFQNNQDQTTWELAYDNPFNSRLPNYHRLDVAANYKFGGRKWKGKIGFSIFNLYNQNNLGNFDHRLIQENEQTRPDGLLRIERNLLGRTPNAFFKISW